jgi:hypothetical protein
MNDFTNTLYDQNADPIQKRTAQTMIDNYKDKAGEIAFYQEAMKGFPQGIPAVAADYAEGIMGAPMAAYGGYIPKAQDGITLYPGGKTKAGTVTPTGKENIFDRDIDYLSQWESAIPGVTNLSNKQAQEKIYDYMLQNEPDVVRNMWGTYGLTAKGLKDPSLKSKYEKGQIDPKSLSDEDLKNLRSAYADSYFGARQLDPIYQAPAAEQPVEKAATPVQKAAVSDAPSFTPATPTRTFPFQQDINNLDMARRNRLSERRYSSYAPRIPYALADAVYLDDTRPQQQIAGRAKGSMDALGAFAGPSRQLSSASLISGQAAEQAANVASTMGNQIIGIANQTGQLNQRAISDVNRANALLDKDVYDNTVKTDEIFDEKMRRYRINDALLSNRMLDNMYRADTYNKMNPLYQITPDQGRYYNTGNIELMPGVSAAMFDYENYTPQSQGAENARKALYDEAMQNPYLTPEDRSELARDYYSSSFGGGSRSTQSTGTRSRKKRDDELAALDQLRQRQQLAEMYGVDPRSVYPGGYYDPGSFGI